MLSLIVAVSQNGVIGSEGTLPWNLPTDLANFKNITSGHKVLMGRKTFENVGILPNRDMYVASHDNTYNPSGVTMVRSYQAFLDQYENTTDEIFIAGGAQMYSQAIPQLSKAYVTTVLANISGDTKVDIKELSNRKVFFPVKKQIYLDSEVDQYPFVIFDYENKNKISGILNSGSVIGLF